MRLVGFGGTGGNPADLCGLIDVGCEGLFGRAGDFDIVVTDRGAGTPEWDEFEGGGADWNGDLVGIGLPGGAVLARHNALTRTTIVSNGDEQPELFGPRHALPVVVGGADADETPRRGSRGCCSRSRRW